MRKLFRLLIIGSLALAGCQSVRSYQPDISWVGTEDAVVLMTAPEFENTPSRHIVFTDIWQREEYALFQGGGAQAEIIYAAADERDTVDRHNPYLPIDAEPGVLIEARNLDHDGAGRLLRQDDPVLVRRERTRRTVLCDEGVVLVGVEVGERRGVVVDL